MTQAAREAHNQLNKVSEFRPTHLNVAWLTAAWKEVAGRRDEEAKEVRARVRYLAAINETAGYPQWLKAEAHHSRRFLTP